MALFVDFVFAETTPFLGKFNFNPQLKARAPEDFEEPLPDYPQVIVVPGTLLGQWEDELKAVLQRKHFDVFSYGSGVSGHQAFWDKDGPYHKSNQPESRRVIIIPHSVSRLIFLLPPVTQLRPDI